MTTIKSYKRITAKICLMALCLGAVATFSSVNAQSQLSLFFPFGVPLQQNSGTSFFMGGAANAVAGDYAVMLRNPANLGFIDRTVFSSLFAFQFNRIAQAGIYDNFNQGNPRQVSIGIPVGKFGGIGLSCDNRSNAETKFRPAPEKFGFDTSTITYRGGLATTGGLISWQVGWGRDIPELLHLRVGAAYERVYFSYTETILRTFTDISRTIDSRDSTYKTFGADAVRGGALLPLWKFKVGLSGEYYFPAEVKLDNAIYSTTSDTSASSGITAVPIDRREQSARVRVPPSFTLGISYTVNPEWLAAVDYNVVQWNSFNGHGLFSSNPSGTTQSFSAGVQYVPVISLLYPKYWETLRYAAGFRYTELPAIKSSEFAFSFGAGLPIGKGRGEFDIGAELGRRTSGKYPDYSENFLQIGIGINGGRKWSKSSAGNY
jgi:hypothetical protein